MSANDHGSDSTYTNHRCRCEPCVEAHRACLAAYRERLRARPPEDWPHGTPTGYTNYGCRCLECREARRAETRRLARLREWVAG